MKTKIFKIIALIMSAVVMISVMCVTAAAEDITESKVLKANEKISYSNKAGIFRTIFYKVQISEAGELHFYCDSYTSDKNYGFNELYPKVCLLDKYGCAVTSSMNLGGNISSAAPFKVSKGTYYIKFVFRSNSDSFTNFFYTYTKTQDPGVKIALTVKKGKTLKLGSVVSNYSGKIKWTTSDKSVAKVSKGTVKAVKSGKATIRAELDNGIYTEIVVNVK